MQPFFVKTSEIPNGKGRWSYELIEIYDNRAAEPKKVGEYTRNYHCFGKSTFNPFKIGENWFALYSRKYVATRVMSLPDCKDLGGEDEVNPGGFCPTGYFVPVYNWFEFDHKMPDGAMGKIKDKIHFALEDHKDDGEPFFYENYGFVSGTVWGDDSTGDKLEYLDLSRANEGIITRSQKFGYFILADKPLYKSIDILDEEGTYQITLDGRRYFDKKDGEFVEYKF